MKTLIADDSFSIRTAMQRFLHAYGECNVAVDGKEAIEAFQLALEQKSPYDLICLDMMMPGMNGDAALKKIREIERSMGVSPTDEVTIVMITADGSPKNVLKSFYKDGCSGYVTKPIRFEKLTELIKKLGLIS
ncbi:MAG: response regulator [Candidatus Magnetominusculus sp. LBB02]|nr:response regulator [Candidatus Magnetominusculus sp. LBB02]